MSDLETAIRHELGIPDEAQHVLLLSMDAHMDWDWQVTFQDYLTGTSTDHSAVTEIIDEAFGLMTHSQPKPKTYYYSVCEMGFLASAVRLNPGLLVDFAGKIGNKLRIVGGGVTSPDNLLPHGEAIIRNYLVGNSWMQKTLGLPLRQAYVPDDFGNDSQFPVLLQAMGFQGVSFARVPGGPQQGPPARREDGGPTLHQQLVKDGVDFVWTAADKSSTIAHYMQQHYCQGQDVGQDPLGQIQMYIDTNQPSAPTPYIYVPCGCDFKLPIPNLVQAAVEWNCKKYKNPMTDVYVAVATLDHYNQLLSTYVDPDVKHDYGPYRPLKPMNFFATPYWTGFYASRIENKILHQAATRALLGAETFSAIAGLLQAPDALAFEGVTSGRDAAIAGGWASVVPSTHHDYITGTASDAVYTSEQVPLLTSALALGAGARASALQQIASQVEATPTRGTPIVIFNQLGFPVTGAASLPGRPGFTPTRVTFEKGGSSAVQIGPHGEYEFLASAPSLGYQVGYLTESPGEPAGVTGVTAAGDAEVYVLENSRLKAIISRSAKWGISTLIDKDTDTDVFPRGAVGNDLVFYIDDGGIYRFGNEYDGPAGGGTPVAFEIDPDGVLTAQSSELLDDGAVRTSVRTTVSFTSTDAGGQRISGAYIREYTLVGEEPFLRMSLTGSASLGTDGHQYAVMIRFPFADPATGRQATVDDVSFGTPYHWVTQLPVPYWPSPTFQAMHNFLLPQARQRVLGAIYQSTIPAWAVDASGAMIGCVLRNTPRDHWNGEGGNHGQDGQDTGTHTHYYAIRVPSGITSPADGLPLRESLQVSTPLMSAFAQVPILDGEILVPSYPSWFSLASATPSSAIITTAKNGTIDTAALVLRVYQPTNAPLNVTLALTDRITNQAGVQARWVTALEDDIPNQPPLPIQQSAIRLTADHALATVEVTGFWSNGNPG